MADKNTSISHGFQASDGADAASLTPAELAIVRGLLAGKTLKQIAADRDRHYNCITAQAHNLRARLGFANNVQLGAWAREQGL